MPISRMDHFTILTTNAEKTSPSIATYSDLRPDRGRRFHFPAPGSTTTGRRCCMSLKSRTFRRAAACSTTSRFRERKSASYVAKLKARGIKYDLRRLPEPGHAGGLWQLFFFDPSGARVEIDFAPTESVAGEQISAY